MIGLDTNILVRFVTRDDRELATAATRLIESRCTAETPGYVCVPVLVELVWVLRRGYRYEKTAVVKVVGKLLGAAELIVEDSETVRLALRDYESGTADFADYLIGRCNHARGFAPTYTFDRRAARDSLFKLAT
ncbi:MAG: type II toxin-antitoxin system VapC family toxin [Gemmatimonadota bacterium]|uniref:PIN domain-containing protein n=1 Tax=Candidatus Palauibacter scopulicola TaxID=3056741 RepID=UPI0023887099|nr:type II toxin-antitoxin system VapC family toxin [Candidatus Palauibacter scopulicola]MDE2661869.1 type II toxin-antitoxin system VapC family toxin [Candidatus Palauibacter scopulicola]